jgi:hypothetical protein
MKHLNSILSGQKISFGKQMKVTFKKADIKKIIVDMLDVDEYMNQTLSLDPRIHSMNAFFTFFFIHDHCIDNSRNLGFSDLLWNDEDTRVLYAGFITESTRSFCGLQSKEFYPLCEFITNHNLWPDHSDIRVRKSKTLKGKIAKPFIKALRTGVKFITKGKLCSRPYDELLNKEVRGYKLIMNKIIGHQRIDLIDLCEKYNAKQTFPNVLRSVAECTPEKIMSVAADESLLLAMEKFYSNKYKKNILERIRDSYIPRTIEFANIMAGLMFKK